MTVSPEGPRSGGAQTLWGGRRRGELKDRVLSDVGTEGSGVWFSTPGVLSPTGAAFSSFTGFVTGEEILVGTAPEPQAFVDVGTLG